VHSSLQISALLSPNQCTPLFACAHRESALSAATAAASTTTSHFHSKSTPSIYFLYL
jgi:hypothetical protein